MPNCEECGARCGVHDLGIRNLNPKDCKTFKPIEQGQILEWDKDAEILEVMRGVRRYLEKH